MSCPYCLSSLFFLSATPPTEIYTLSLHDALPISDPSGRVLRGGPRGQDICGQATALPIHRPKTVPGRSEEHTSELQSHSDLVCRLLLEKKKKKTTHQSYVH